jgi:hypothetical protein
MVTKQPDSVGEESLMTTVAWLEIPPSAAPSEHIEKEAIRGQTA